METVENDLCTIYRRIDCEQIRSRIYQQLIAGCFGPRAFVSSYKTVFYMQLTKALGPKRPAISCWLILLRICSQSIRLYVEDRSKEPLQYYCALYVKCFLHAQLTIYTYINTVCTFLKLCLPPAQTSLCILSEAIDELTSSAVWKLPTYVVALWLQDSVSPVLLMRS